MEVYVTLGERSVRCNRRIVFAQCKRRKILQQFEKQYGNTPYALMTHGDKEAIYFYIPLCCDCGKKAQYWLDDPLCAICYKNRDDDMVEAYIRREEDRKEGLDR